MKKDNKQLNEIPTPLSPEALAEQWADQNREAIESSNRYVEEHGLPLEKARQF